MTRGIKRLFCLAVCALSLSGAWANDAFDNLILEKIVVNPEDVASIKRGAAFFAKVCMSCHTMVYLRYDKLATTSGVQYDKMPVNVKTWPNGVTPPDLSLVVNIRGASWVYTYLHSFYQDATRPFGVNNLLVPNTAMPNILTAYQGTQVLLPSTQWQTGVYSHQLHWYDVVALQQQGAMSPEQFDATMYDVVNFLNYAAAPYAVIQHRLGVWVLSFLVVLWVLTYLLKKTIWQMLAKKEKSKNKTS